MAEIVFSTVFFETRCREFTYIKIKFRLAVATYRSRVLSPVYNEIRRVYNRKTRREIYFVFSLRWTVWSIFSGTVAQEFFAPPFVFNITGISWYTNAGIHLSHQISQIWEAGITIATCQRPLDPLLLMNVCTGWAKKTGLFLNVNNYLCAWHRKVFHTPICSYFYLE